MKTHSLKAAVAFYLESRRRLGFALEAQGALLENLIEYAHGLHHRGPLTTELALNWAQAPPPTNPLRRARRLEAVRRFAAFGAVFDPRTPIPPAALFGPAYRRISVHIYTPQEIAALLAAEPAGAIEGLESADRLAEFDHDYAPLLRNVGRKADLTDAEADEVTQETLIAVAKKIGEFTHAGNRGSFRAWLYQQARWRIADQFRARARARLWDEEWEESVRESALARVKRQVSARQFQLFDLHVLQGLPVRAAAQAAGTTQAAVYMAKSRVGRLVHREIMRLRKLER